MGYLLTMMLLYDGQNVLTGAPCSTSHATTGICYMQTLPRLHIAALALPAASAAFLSACGMIHAATLFCDMQDVLAGALRS